MKQKIRTFAIVSFLALLFCKTFIFPLDKNVFLVFGIFLVSYPLWRRKNKLSLTKTALIYTISTYFLYVAWYRISNSILYNYNYYVNSDVVYVSSTKALLGALPFVVIALALVIDELFIDSE